MRRLKDYSVVKMLGLAAVAALGVVGPAEAAVNAYVPVGIIAGQTFRVATANFGEAPCEVAVFINAGDGTSLLAERGIIIVGGKVAVRDVAPADFRGRLEIFAQVLVSPDPGCQGMLQASVQVFDTASGQTLLATHGFVIEGGIPAPR